MDASRIMNEIDNAENEHELQEFMGVFLQDITAQVMAVWNATNDNSHVAPIKLEDLTKSIHACVQSEYLAPGTVLD